LYPAAPDSLLTTGAAAVKPQLTILGTLGGSDASAAASPLPKPGLDRPLLPQDFVQPAIVNGIVVKGLPAELRDMLQKQSAVVQAIIPEWDLLVKLLMLLLMLLIHQVTVAVRVVTSSAHLQTVTHCCCWFERHPGFCRCRLCCLLQ